MAGVDVRVARRKLFIKLGKRHHRAGLGSSREFLSRRTADMNWPNLSTVLKPTPYAVVGGVATRLYMPERLTKDLDVVVFIADSAAAKQRLESAGYEFVGKLSLVQGTTWVSSDGREVDVLEGEERWWPQAIAEAQTNLDFQGQPVLTLPYLTLMKYQAGRAQDLADIERMLGQADDLVLDEIRGLFRKHAEDELADLESLITLARLDGHTE